MLDARNIYRKVTRKIYDFSPEQMQNLSAIIWLYRGQRERFLKLVRQYFASVCDESREIAPKIGAFEKTLVELRERFVQLSTDVGADNTNDEEKKKAFAGALAELTDAERPYEGDRDKLLVNLDKFLDRYAKKLPKSNDDQHSCAEIVRSHCGGNQGTNQADRPAVQAYRSHCRPRGRIAFADRKR